MKIANTQLCIFFILNHLFCLSSNKEPITLYCHGLNSSSKRIEKLKNLGIIQNPSQSFDFDHSKKDIGQEHDIAILHQQIKNNETYTGYGHSRGGCTLIPYLAQHQPPNITALVLDASPADIIDRVDEIQYSYGFCPFQTRESKEWILRKLYPGYTQNGTPPFQTIKKIQNKSLPVFIVHSHDDQIVNIRAAYKNYKAFKDAQFPHVYLCELNHGGHSKNIEDPFYKTALHSFYKKHGLPHDPQHATLDNLTHLQPSVEHINEQIKIQETKLLQRYQTQRSLNLWLGIHTTFLVAAAILKIK